MKFTCTHQNFLKGLNITEKVIGKNFSLPILQNILVSCEKNKGNLKLSSTDLEMGVEILIPAKIEEEGNIAIPAKLLGGFIRSLPSEKIEFSEKNRKVSIQCQNYKANIKGEDGREFPIIPQNLEEEGFLTKSDIFLSGITPVVSSASLLDIKPEISGVYIQLRENDSLFTATDSFRLAEKTVKNDGKNNYVNSIILPRRTCDILVRIFEDLKGDFMVNIHSNQITIKNSPQDPITPKITFVSKVIDGDYPKYEQIIPTSFTTSIKAQKHELIQHIRTAGLFSSKIREVSLKTNSQKQCLEITSEDATYGDHHSTLHCEIEGKEGKSVLNFEYLLDGLQSISSDTILIKMNEPTTPILISSFKNEGFRYILMPIKT